MRKSRRRTAAQEQPDVKPSKLARAFDIPEGVFSDFSQISLSGNREAVIEGCGGVLEYDSTLIKLSLNKMILQFTGRNLEIKCMTGESVIVHGFILGIEFLV
ncbi:YabP/YqfC family sporulation protein [Hydrogenoanaerobacterium sp.]|uniref:YabP/YqfC family sporulation protein n=1 Tax=Hydrogenoanaerobacterium sp. TaxID=2953763 RepID=UPI002897468C|nr:YabP/YqfC family sporulation protein [Hydrogenoanaerobacterium sp.]